MVSQGSGKAQVDIDRNRYRQSTNSNNYNKSIIDKWTNDIQTKLSDDSIGSALIAKSLRYLGEAQLISISDYVLRKASNPGHAFVKICGNELAKKDI